MKMIAIRLKPGQDLKVELQKLVKKHGITAGFIATCVGSLQTVTLRMAGATLAEQDIRTLDGHFEIVSLVGTVSVNRNHLHLSVSDEEGGVTGGHLKEGSIIATTAEVVIGFDEDVIFTSDVDKNTGFKELELA